MGLAEPALAYDYFKSMVSLNVATLGGILTLGETVFGARIVPWQMAIAALAVAISGLLALQGQTHHSGLPGGQTAAQQFAVGASTGSELLRYGAGRVPGSPVAVLPRARRCRAAALRTLR